MTAVWKVSGEYKTCAVLVCRYTAEHEGERTVKKLRITVQGVAYEVDVEVLEDDDQPGYGGVPSVPNVQRPASPAPAPAPAAAPAPAPSGGGGASEGDKVLTSPIAGILVEIKPKVGDMVKENDTVAVIEAMKMNTNVNSPVGGKVKEVRGTPGEPVQQGQVLLTFE